MERQVASTILFDTTNKGELFRLLYEIEEKLPWTGLSVGKPPISMIGCEGIES